MRWQPWQKKPGPKPVLISADHSARERTTTDPAPRGVVTARAMSDEKTWDVLRTQILSAAKARFPWLRADSDLRNKEAPARRWGTGCSALLIQSFELQNRSKLAGRLITVTGFS